MGNVRRDQGRFADADPMRPTNPVRTNRKSAAPVATDHMKMPMLTRNAPPASDRPSSRAVRAHHALNRTNDEALHQRKLQVADFRSRLMGLLTRAMILCVST